MNENIERVLDVLDGFRMDDEMTYAAYSRLHDLISELDDLLNAQEPVEPRYIVGKRNRFIMCGNCNTDLMRGMKYCSYCGKAVKWE